jgi:hypothetical protein
VTCATSRRFTAQLEFQCRLVHRLRQVSAPLKDNVEFRRVSPGTSDTLFPHSHCGTEIVRWHYIALKTTAPGSMSEMGMLRQSVEGRQGPCPSLTCPTPSLKI